MAIPEQIALAITFYFEQVFVFSRLTKNVLEWFQQIMCKEHTLAISTNLLFRNCLTLCFSAGAQYLTLWIITFSTYRSVRLEFFRTVTSETILEKKETVQFS